MSATYTDPTASEVHDQHRDHVLVLVVYYQDMDRLTAKLADGRSCYYLEQAGVRWLLPDRVRGVCSCGAAGDLEATWQDARWWAREHRTSVGLPIQPWLGERVDLLA